MSKITAAQIFLLLGSITDKEGQDKWDSQAHAIRKVDSPQGVDRADDSLSNKTAWKILPNISVDY